MPLLKPLSGPMAGVLAGLLRAGVGTTDDDGNSQLLHLVLLLVLGGILLGTSLEVMAHRYHFTWLPGCALSTLCGVLIGTLIRVTHDPEDIPGELLFSGNVLFIVCIPIIIFDAGFSLRKKEYLGSLFSIISFSVIGTLLSAFLTGGILFGAGANGLCLGLDWNEAMAYASILSATDAMSSATIYSALGVDPALMTLIGGEGSLNDAVAIVMYQTFSGFVENGTAGESGQSLLGRFLGMLTGSVAVGLLVGVASTFVFRYVHIGPTRDRGLVALHAWVGRTLCGGRCGQRSSSQVGEGERVPLARAGAGLAAPAAASFQDSHHLDAAAAGGGEGRASHASAESESDAEDDAGDGAHPATPLVPVVVAGGVGAATAAGAAPGLGGNLLRPYASVNAVRAGVAASGAKAGLDGFGAHGGASSGRGGGGGEVKPDSSVFAQVSFVMTMAYFSYMAAEAFHLSGVVSCLFAGIALNNFVRPLMTREGKAFSEGTVRSLAAVADTGSFFQVGVSIAMTIGTAEGIADGADGEFLAWTLFSILLGRAVAVALVGSAVNYFRREEDRIPASWLVLLWHAGLRGAGTYAFSLVFPTHNRDLLVDVTAAVVLFTVFVLGSTTKAAVMLLGVPFDEHGHDEAAAPGAAHGAAAGSGKHAPHGHAALPDGTAIDASGDRAFPPHAALVMSAGVAYRVFVKSGARVAVPVAAPSASERTASSLSRLDARLRWWISGVVRAD